MRHVLSLLDLTTDEIEQVFALSVDLKAKLLRGVREPLLAGRVQALLFEKPSLRTRVSFEAAMTHLGGATQFLGQDVGWGTRESIADFSRVLSQYADVIVCRANSHKRVVELAAHSACPVINGLTDKYHPCQALADILTLREEFGDSLKERTVAYVGDANNVSRSLAIACARLGYPFAIAAPKGYQFDASFGKELAAIDPSLKHLFTDDPQQAAARAACIYTDVWASMGQEAEQATREKAFAPYQVNERLMAAAPADAIFLHCLPAKRGQEVTDAVIDGANSRIVEQAANRMHAQKGLLAWLLGS